MRLPSAPGLTGLQQLWFDPSHQTSGLPSSVQHILPSKHNRPRGTPAPTRPWFMSPRNCSLAPTNVTCNSLSTFTLPSAHSIKRASGDRAAPPSANKFLLVARKDCTCLRLGCPPARPNPQCEHPVPALGVSLVLTVLHLCCMQAQFSVAVPRLTFHPGLRLAPSAAALG